MPSRRGHGEGSIYQRSEDGRWCTVVDLGYVNGKRKRKYIYGDTRKEVAEKLKVVLRDQQQGLPIAAERLTVAACLSRWLADVVKGTVRPTTYTSYEGTVRLHIVPTLGRIELSKLTAQHVTALLNAKGEAGLSPRSVKYIRTVLRVALNQAVKWNLVVRNVVTLVPTPRVERHEAMAFTPEQARRFLEAIRGERLEALYSVALALGLRQGEALALHWSDVNLDAGTLRVRHALQRVDGKLSLVQPKTEQSRRTIDLPPPTVAALRAHWERQMEERQVAGTRWKEHGLVFTTKIGTPLEKGNVFKWFKKMLEAADLPDMRFHDLRHCCASLLLAQNVHPKVVQEILGHSQIAMTLDLYSHVIPSVKKDAAALMGTLLAANE